MESKELDHQKCADLSAILLPNSIYEQAELWIEIYEEENVPIVEISIAPQLVLSP